MHPEIVQQFTQMALSYLPTAVLAIVTLFVGFKAIGWLSHLTEAAFRRRNMDPTVEGFLTSLISVGLKVLLLLSVAGMFGIQTTSFIAIFSALAFAVGTALSGSLGHFASGVMLLTFRPYKAGDLVTLAGQTGVVEEIQMFNTVLLTPDNKRIIIPNGLVTGSIITNISGQGKIRVDMHYGVGNSAEMEKVRAVIQQVHSTCPTSLKTEDIDIFVENTTPVATQILVRPWTKSEHYWDTYFYFQENIRQGFARHGIPAPDPER